MIKYYHFSDCHVDQLNTLTNETKFQIPIFSYEILVKIEYIIDSAIKNKIPLIIFSGDMFKDSFSDFDIKNKINKRLIWFFKKANNHWIKIVLLSWNHDCSINSKKNISKEHLLELHEIIGYENIYVSSASYNEITKHTILIWSENLDIVLFPYLQDETLLEDNTIKFTTKENVYDYLKEIINEKSDNPMIMVWHFDVIWAKINNWNKMKEDIKSNWKNPNIWSKTELYSLLEKDQSKGFDAILLWHYHEYQDIFDKELNKDIEETCLNKVYYAWSTQKITFGEEGQTKWFVEWTLEHKSNWKWSFHKQFIELPDRNWISFNLTIDSSIEDPNEFILNEIKKRKNELKNSIVRVIIQIDSVKITEIVEEPIKEYLKKQGVFILKKNSFVYHRNQGNIIWLQDTEENKTTSINQKIATTYNDILDEFFIQSWKEENEKNEYKSLMEELLINNSEN